MIIEVLSDHPGEQLRKVGDAYEQHARALARHHAGVDQLRAKQRTSRRWWQVLTRIRHGAALRALERRPPELDPDLERRRAQQASGIGGEEAMTAALGVLSDEWVLFRGYANRRGEVDHLLVGPGGVWAIEVKVRGVQIHVAGDQWRYEKFDRYGNRVEQGVLADRRGRSWGRQVADVAGELEAFLASRGQDVNVRSAVVVLHDRAEVGSCRDLRVDLLCVGSDCLLEGVGTAWGQLPRPDREAVARLVRRDHAFHAKKGKRHRGGDRGRRRS